MSATMKPMKSNKPVVISYLRFSRPEQLKGDSIRRQLMLGEEWAKRNNMQIADTYRDLGISAFRGKNAAEGALSQLLKLADDGRVPRGSVLLVEQLDRLSRSALLEALELFLSIIRRGIKVVTLMDGQEYDRESLSRNMMQLQYSIMQMALAHEESQKKSERLAHAWDGKRQKIMQKVLTRRMPAWLKLEDGKIVIDQEKAAVVRRMVKLVMDGHGLTAVTKKLNGEFTGLARVKYFQRSYVTKILHSRALIGEFQPHKLVYRDGKKFREPVGEPLKDYYPRVLDDRTYYAAQKRLESRRTTGGRNTEHVNLFVGMLFDKDGSRLQISNKGYGRRYVSSAALLGRTGASDYVGFPVDAMERAVLLQLHDVILPRLRNSDADDKSLEAEALEARIAEVERKITDTQELMLSDSAVGTASVVAMLGKLDTTRQRLAEQHEELRGEIASRGSVDIDIARDRLAEVARYYKRGEINMTHDERVELQNIIRLTIARLDADVERLGSRNYSAALRVTLRDGGQVSFVVFAHHQDTMQRNAKGHPVKSAATGKLPTFRVSIGDPIFMAVTSADGQDLRVGPAPRRARLDAKIPIQKALPDLKRKAAARA